jgi:hypothetical protein
MDRVEFRLGGRGKKGMAIIKISLNRLPEKG